MELVLGQVIGWDKVVGPLVGATVTGVFALVIWWLNVKRPTRILVQELDITSLIRIADTVRPRITATLDGKPVARLSQVEVSITNESAETIKDILIRFRFSELTEILECELSNDEATRTIESTNELLVAIPFLNSRRYHKDRVIAKLICDGPVRECTVTGRGEGWSAFHWTFEGEMRNKLKWTLGSTGIASVIVLGYAIFAQKFFNVDPNEFSLRAFLFALPMVLVMVVPLISTMKLALRMIRRLH
jgi:hypothetical protein